MSEEWVPGNGGIFIAIFFINTVDSRWDQYFFCLQPTAYSLQPTAYSLQPTAYSLQPTAYSLQPTAYSLQPTAY